MQALTAAPREQLLAVDVDRLLHADDTILDAVRAELLDLDDRVLADISDDVRMGDAAPVVSWDGSLAIHRKVDLTIARSLTWDRDRIRLSCRLRSRLLGTSAWFYSGVFVMVAPDDVADDRYLRRASRDTGAGPGSTRQWTATGYDKLHLLQSELPDVFTAATDGTVIDPTSMGGTGLGATTLAGVLRALLAAAEYRGKVVIDPRLASLTIPDPIVFPVDGNTTWLTALNGTLTAVGGDTAWCDEVGSLQLQLLTQIADRTPEYIADAQSSRTIVGPVRKRTRPLEMVPNRWRFIASGWPETPTVENGGIYIPEPNTGQGLTSISSRGRSKWKTRTLDVSTAAALKAAGDAQRAEDMRTAGARTLTLGSLPILGHRDLIEVRDAVVSEPARAVVNRWSLRYDGRPADVEVQEVA